MAESSFVPFKGSKASHLGSVFGKGLGGIGQGFSEHINEGLQMLAQQKMLKIQQANTAHGLEPIFGKKGAEALSKLPPEYAKQLMQNPGAIMKLLGGEDNSNATGLNALNNINNQHDQQQSSYTQPGISNDEELINAVQQTAQVDRNRAIELIQKNPNLAELYNQSKQGENGAPQQPRPASNAQPLQDLSERSQLIADAFTSPQERRANRELEIKERKLEQGMSKESREFLHPFVVQANTADINKIDYSIIKDLAKKKDLISGPAAQALTKVGLLDYVRNPTTEAFQKVSARLAQNVSGVFGTNSRVTNYLESVFQRSLPSLFNSPEGIELIADLNLMVGDLADRRLKIGEEIIEKNRGSVPGNADAQIRNKMQPYLEQTEKKMIQAVNRVSSEGRVSKSFNELPSAIQYKGRKIVDNETGKTLRSDGKKWVEED